jgi:hypothetical protein
MDPPISVLFQTTIGSASIANRGRGVQFAARAWFKSG